MAAINNYGQFSTGIPQYNYNSQQNYIQYLQSEIARLQAMQNPSPQPAQSQQFSELSLPVRHADITLIKSKAIAKKEAVENGSSRMFMNEAEDEIYVKTVDENGTAILYTYLRQEPENITNETDFVTKADMKSFLDDAVSRFSALIPKEEDLVRKNEIRDIIVETISSGRTRKREEE